MYLGQSRWDGDLRAETQELKGAAGGCLGRRNTLKEILKMALGWVIHECVIFSEAGISPKI